MQSSDRKKQILQAVRFDVWKTRFGNDMSSRQCPCCNLNVISLTNFDCGHIISSKNGGVIDPNNLIPICGSCNKSIGSCNMNEHVKLSGLDWTKIKQSLGGEWNDDIDNSVECKEKTDCCENKEPIINDMSSVTIVKYIKMLRPNDFIWKHDCLYCYDGKYWEKSNLPLMIYIGNELYEYLRDILTTYFWDTKPQSKEYARMKYSLGRLRNLQFKKEIIETSKELFTNNEHMFDNKWYLFGFKNLVLDLRTLEFRDYKFDDYITVTTGYDWIEPERNKVDKINKLIESIHPNNDEKQLYLEILATGLEGRPHEKFIIFNKKGDNGKGLINDLALKMFGNHGMIGNNALLFENNKTGSNPEKNNMHLRRFIIFREPPERSKIENSIMKEFTGGLYNSDTKKELSCTIILECNKRPLFAEKPSEADLRRLIDIYFPRRFTDKKENVDEENNVFLANITYKNEDFQEEHKTALFRILLNAYKCYKDREYTFKIPQSVENRTKLYLQMSSAIYTWISDEHEKTENKNDFLTIKEMYYNFKTSEYYANLSKADKRKYNERFFRNEISENIFLSKYYHERKRINGVDYNNILTHYKRLRECDNLV
jgi:phage/plasmid-associated DNA primase